MLNKLKPLSGGGFRMLEVAKPKSQSDSSLFKYECYQYKIATKSAFTLAEVLITIAIIGFIAAITIPIVLPMIQEKIDSHRHANIVHKITQATDVMKSLNELNRFQNTDDFVDVLQKHLKIIKRCDSEHIADCWPTEKVITAEGKEFEIKKAKTRKNLGFENDRENPNVGLVLNDGAAIILTYDADANGLGPTDALKASAKTLPVGGGKKEFLEFTTNSTASLAFIVDVNGAKKPNSETRDGKYHDIRSLNAAKLSEGCIGTEIGNTCYTQIDSYEPVDCSHPGGSIIAATLNHPENYEYCGDSSYHATDYKAGAIKACKNIGMELPDITQLKSICTSYKNELGLTGIFMSSSNASNYGNGIYDYFAALSFSNCSNPNPTKRRSFQGNVICIGRS